MLAATNEASAITVVVILLILVSFYSFLVLVCFWVFIPKYKNKNRPALVNTMKPMTINFFNLISALDGGLLLTKSSNFRERLLEKV
jgi:hypothetical protein